MNIVTKYPIQVEQWLHLATNKFLGQNQEFDYHYIFGITPEDKKEPECIYFNIWIEKRIENITTATRVFYAKTYSCFKIRNDFKCPTAELFFEAIESATLDFALEFHRRTRGTNLSFNKTRKPVFENLRRDIEMTIQIWNSKYRNQHLLKAPNWQERFRHLPPIPEHKKWQSDSHSTLEQDISFKLLHGKEISEREENIFQGLLAFYPELDTKLQELDYTTFTGDDFENFANYINYVFSFMGLITNKLLIRHTYRLVVNESVLGENVSITNINDLKYPPLSIVKVNNKYNRCNTPNTTLFYSTENIDTALKEIRPPINKLVTVGLWRPIDPEQRLNSFPISHSLAAQSINESVSKAKKAFDELSKIANPLFLEYLDNYFQVLGREYTKRTKHHFEFLTSAMLSEQIFKGAENSTGDFKIDCIVYPSVGNDFLIENTAILPEVVDKYFHLVEVTEFEVEEAYYDKEYTILPPDIITVAKIRNRRRARFIGKDGKIVW